MAAIIILEAIIIFLCLMSLNNIFKKILSKNPLPISWPIIGMLPYFLKYSHKIHDYGTDVLRESGGTFKIEGGIFHNIDMVATCDPANIHHILSANFQNYPKGPEFREMFDILGDGIFNTDSELWEMHRKVTMSLMNNSSFFKILERTVWENVENGLVYVLDNFAKNGVAFDLQDIFQRFFFDSISNLVLDFNPKSLSIDLRDLPCEKAMNYVGEALFYRHTMPKGYWKMQKWLGIGMEKKLSIAWEVLDQYIYGCIEKKLKTRGENREESSKREDSDLLTAFMEAYEGQATASFSEVKVILRDTMSNLIFAGRDSSSTALTWLLWLVTTNPSTKTKILEEIELILDVTKGNRMRRFTVEESRKLVYLHGAVCEALRLYPPVAINHKSPVNTDVLPSGIQLYPNTKVILFFYGTGRMESVWGKDCLEFKPERWISEKGKNKYEPSYKFPAFNAGPRTCVGKEMSFIQIKMVAATIIHNYDIHVVEGHQIAPSDSVILRMKNGLLVTISKRN